MRYLALLLAIGISVWAAEPAREKPIINPPPAERDWADLAKLPDWSGVWNPKITDQDAQARTNMPPWNAKAAALVAHQLAEEKAGRPPPLFVNCLPEAMPAWMLVTHNAMEILFTPGRVTLLGESACAASIPMAAITPMTRTPLFTATPSGAGKAIRSWWTP